MNGQNATDGAVSTPAEIMLPGVVARVAKRYNVAAKGNGLGGITVQPHKLFAACASELRSLRGLGESRLPADVADELSEAVNSFIDDTIRLCVNRSNFTKVSMRAVIARGGDAIECKHLAEGRTAMSLDKQLFHAKLMRNEAEKRIERCVNEDTRAKAIALLEKREQLVEEIKFKIEQAKEALS